MSNVAAISSAMDGIARIEVACSIASSDLLRVRRIASIADGHVFGVLAEGDARKIQKNRQIKSIRTTGRNMCQKSIL